MSSTRLPGKVLADVGGEPVLALLIRRLKKAHEIAQIKVATSTDLGDDVVAEVARDLGVGVHRGARDDVLSRFVEASRGHNGAVVRITADCPLIDPDIVDRIVALFHDTSGCDYASNVEPRTFPVGLDVEVFSTEALQAAARLATDPYDREHVTTLVRRNPQRFRFASLRHDDDLSDLRWTVDDADDLAFVRQVVARLGPRRYDAGMKAIREAVVAEPSLAAYRGRRA